MNPKNKLTQEKVIARFRDKFGHKFDYSEFEYKGVYEYGHIICPIHGGFDMTPQGHWQSKYGCPKCKTDAQSKRLSDTTETFVTKAERVHGKGVFDYSLVDYKGGKPPVEIVCQHGHHFLQSPNAHLNGHGCPECKRLALRKKAGIINCNESLKDNFKAYRVWGAMLERCYGLNGGPKYPSYEGVEVCDEWRYNFANFLEWHNQNYVDGWQLDKDLLSPADSVCYSPDTCCYLPLEINRSIHTKKPSFTITPCGRYRVNLSIGKRRGVNRGCYLTYEEALVAYKSARAERMRELADKYKGQLSERVYNALINLYK